MLLIRREVKFGDAQGIKTQVLSQGLQLSPDCRQGGGRKVGRAGHGGSV
jgi:hypothetical protein